MRGIKWAGLIGLALTTAIWAQKPADPATKGDEKAAAEKKNVSLEELLAKALQHSPEVQVAEAKLREADANLRQTRLQVAQRLVDLHTNIDTQQKTLASAEMEYKRLHSARQAGTVSSGEVGAAESNLAAIKGRLASIEASLATLTGKFPGNLTVESGASHGSLLHLVPVLGGSGGVGTMPDAEPKPRLPRKDNAEKLQAALERPLKKFDTTGQEVPLKDMIGFVRELAPGVPILANFFGHGDEQVRIDYKGELTVGTFFQVLTDTVPGLKIFVRDYGFLITFEGHEPNDGLTLMDFWQGTKK